MKAVALLGDRYSSARRSVCAPQAHWRHRAQAGGEDVRGARDADGLPASGFERCRWPRPATGPVERCLRCAWKSPADLIGTRESGAGGGCIPIPRGYDLRTRRPPGAGSSLAYATGAGNPKRPGCPGAKARKERRKRERRDWPPARSASASGLRALQHLPGVRERFARSRCRRARAISSWSRLAGERVDASACSAPSLDLLDLQMPVSLAATCGRCVTHSTWQKGAERIAASGRRPRSRRRRCRYRPRRTPSCRRRRCRGRRLRSRG